MEFKRRKKDNGNDRFYDEWERNFRIKACDKEKWSNHSEKNKSKIAKRNLVLETKTKLNLQFIATIRLQKSKVKKKCKRANTFK